MWLRELRLFSLLCLLSLLLSCGGGGDGGEEVAFELPSNPAIAPNPPSTPRPNPSASPTRPAPSATPSATPEPTPSATPEPTPSATPEPTPTPGGPDPNPTLEQPLRRELAERSWSNDRYVVLSTERKLNELDRNSHSDIYLRDLLLGKIDGVTLRADGPSRQASSSADGRFVVFTSSATNLVTGHGGTHEDIFLWNRLANKFICLTEGGDGDSFDPTISADGSTIAFSSRAALLPTDTNSHADIYLYNRQTAQLSLLTGTQTGDAVSPTLNSDGSLAAYNAKQFGYWQIFGWSRAENRTAVLSRNASDEAGNGDSFYPTLSNQGLAYSTRADNLVPNDTNGKEDVLLLVGTTLTRIAEDATAPTLAQLSLHGTFHQQGELKFLRPTISPIPQSLGQGQWASLGTVKVLAQDQDELKAVLPDKGITRTLNPSFVPSPPITGLPFENVGIARYGRVLPIDLNSDGMTDVVSHADDEAGPRGFKLALANPGGTFSTTYMSVGGYLEGYDQGFINNDNFPDLAATVNIGTESTPVRRLKIYFGNGSGGFTAGPVRSITRTSPVPFIGHFSGDNNTDILLFGRTFSGAAPAPQVLIGNGSGNFTDGAILPVTNNPGFPIVGDYDNDGIDDIAVLDDSTGEVAIMLNNGSGAAKVSPQKIGIASPGQLRYNSGLTIDLDLDGDLDLLVDVPLSSERGNVIVLLNDGHGTFSLSTPLEIPLITFGTEEDPVVTGDFDGDGQQEHLLRNVLYNPRTGEHRFWNNNSQGPVLATDLNGDGKLDVLLQQETGLVYVLGHGDGTFGPRSLVEYGTPFYNPVVGDFNGDLLVDILAHRELGLGQPDKTFRFEEHGLPLVDTNWPEDFNNDGNLDLLAWDSAGLVVYLGDGNGHFTPAPPQPVNRLWGVAPELQDIDQDGVVDLFLIRLGVTLENQFEFWKGNGDGTFTLVSSVTQQSSTSLIHLADLDHDGDVDMWAGDYAMLASSPGVFGPPIDHYAYGYYDNAQFIDLDGDLFVEGVSSGPSYSPAWDFFPTPEPAPVVHENSKVFRYFAAVETVIASFIGPERQGQQNHVSVTAAEDADGDGDLDLLLMGSNGYFQYALNNGDGTYSQGTPMFYTSGIRHLTRLDYDFDGQFDKLLTGYHVSFLP